MMLGWEAGWSRISGLRASVFLFIVMVAVGLLVLRAEAQSESQEATESGVTAPVLGPEKEEIAERIFNELIAPCCWTTTVAVHGSGAAPRIQAEVRQMLGRGMEYQEIIDHYVEIYGERILAEPKRQGFNLAAYWVPYLAILIGVVVVLLIIRGGIGRSRRCVTVTDGAAYCSPDTLRSAPAPGGDEGYRRRIEEEVQRIS